MDGQDRTARIKREDRINGTEQHGQDFKACASVQDNQVGQPGYGNQDKGSYM
jgi:hypothetical protein